MYNKENKERYIKKIRSLRDAVALAMLALSHDPLVIAMSVLPCMITLSEPY